jgi:transposase-like protein
MVLDHQGEHASQWAAITSIAAKIGGPSTDERERIKALERENRELRQANEILRKASAYFAMAELDRPFKR